MKNLTLSLAVILLLCTSALAQQDPNDPGMQDSIIIDSVAVGWGQQTVDIRMYAVTDDSVGFYNIPLHFVPDSVGMKFTWTMYYYPVLYWGSVLDTISSDSQYIDLYGCRDPSTVPYLYTWHARIHVLTMHLALPPDLSDRIFIDTTSDYFGGSLYFSLTDSLTHFIPAFKKGYIIPPFGGIGDVSKPIEYTLNQNYPNPFNPSTQIEFALPKAGHVSLDIYNILGQRVRKLLDDKIDAGKYSIIWDGKNGSGFEAPSGTYFYKLTSGDYTQTKKMVLIR